ncbi:hypothetical protein [Cellvibrio sp. PSBB023]|uniref:hypothetical protein n=1 Tax=Cellvibrio sp. PSBB023 TaxID=1945512 RepID=UPI00098EEAE0|nr:hypothetical protein [Cellvibrio sp. PSBB023]AQT59597.1 hypothetical protein B0D95_05460 [Cellvibrio sp. PSBB023]
MISTEMMALNARADAGQAWPDIHFYDRAARALTRLLDIDARVRFSPVDERRYLQANHWLDQRCLAFFNQFPKGLGIECGAGLSTRFHRLSEQHEWPQFSWIDIDTEERLLLKSSAMPVIDNYQLLVNNHANDPLVNEIRWDKTTPLMIVADGFSYPLDKAWLSNLLQSLLNTRSADTPIYVHILLEATSHWYERLLRAIGLSVFGHWHTTLTALGGEVDDINYFGKSTHSKQGVILGVALHF